MENFNLNTILAAFAGTTIILASLIALKQDNLKARLAYSTVGHLSYIVLGAALLTGTGFLGGILHIATHATMKITLFFCAGAIYVNLHREKISQLDGIGKIMPWTMGAFTIGAMGLAGVPPVNGFLSKWFLALGSLEADKIFILVIFIISGLLNAAYLFPIVYRAFFNEGVNLEGYGEASFLMVAPLVCTAVFSVILGLDPDLFFNFYQFAFEIADSLLR